MTSHSADPAVTRRLASMTLAQKAGQVLGIGFDGTSFTPELLGALRALQPGKLILFERNIASPAGVAELTAAAQQAARDIGMPGLIVAVDQEGGVVTRLRERAGYTEFPSMMGVAATPDPVRNAQAVAGAIARELRATGIHMDYAPVLDVNVNPANPVIGARSFGSDPRRVAELGVAVVRALQAEGVLAVGKHFPGHGDTAIDTHFGLPSVPHARARLDAVEFVPFRAAIAAGVDAIMSTHVAFPALEPEPRRPSTLSKRVLTGLLREEMGFAGLILTDSLEMLALSEAGFPPPQAAAAALAAGADMLLFNAGDAMHRAAHAEIMRQVRAGDIAPARLDDAVRRVLTAKAGAGLLDGAAIAAPELAAQVGPGSENWRIARDVAAQSVTLLRDTDGLIPLAAGAALLAIETPYATGLGRALACETFSVGAHPQPDEIAAAIRLARARLAVVGSSDAHKHPQQANLVRGLRGAGIPVIVVATRAPYDAQHMPEAGTALAIYSAAPCALEACAAVLRGRIPARGRLPVEPAR